MSCPFIPPSSSDSQIGSSRNHSMREKKHCDDKPPTRHRFGRAFRNSQGRKDSKSSNSLVMFHLITVNYLYQTHAK